MRKLLKIALFLFFIIHEIDAQDDYLYFVNEANEAMYSRLNIIDNARNELFISYYIFGNDDLSLLFLAILLDKKAKNPDLDIRILLDAGGCRIDRKYLYYCEQKGIEIREFHAIPKLMVPFKSISIKKFLSALQNFNMRMHDKFIIADTIAFITGGRNIENTYYGMSGRNFNDRDIYFYSKSLTTDVRHYYLKLWNSKYVQKITYFSKHKNSKRFKSAETELSKKIDVIKRNRENYEILYKGFHPERIGLPFKRAVFLSSYDQRTDALNPVYLSTSLANLMFKVNKSVLIQTPYLLPTKHLYNLMEYLTKRGVKIEFVTNSNCSTDVMPISAAYDNQKRKFEKLGIDIYESVGPDYLHSKSGVFDDKIALVGSYNLDPRSAAINTELVFVIEDEMIAMKLKEIILNDIKNSVKVEKNSENSFGGYYGCHKTEKEMMTYMFFRILTRIKLFYNQL